MEAAGIRNGIRATAEYNPLGVSPKLLKRIHGEAEQKRP
ncbi:MAG: hypothetical protein Ct9H90mP5_00970 [Acidimicrobiaceae bacterium]|nr:MAG: hypothetical protein Ct9H90mP5_00970 [Acidimicrobiaceae bacterium]